MATEETVAAQAEEENIVVLKQGANLQPPSPQPQDGSPEPLQVGDNQPDGQDTMQEPQQNGQNKVSQNGSTDLPITANGVAHKEEKPAKQPKPQEEPEAQKNPAASSATEKAAAPAPSHQSKRAPDQASTHDRPARVAAAPKAKNDPEPKLQTAGESSQVSLEDSRPWYSKGLPEPRTLTKLELEASATRLSTRFKQTGELDLDWWGPPHKPQIIPTGTETEHEGVLYRRVGTEWVPQRVISPEGVAELVARLSTKREFQPTPPPSVVRLTFVPGAKGGFKEAFVPVKHVTNAEQIAAMAALGDRCVETRKKTQEDLAGKYLQPFCHVKQLQPGEAAEHAAKMQRLYQGLGVLER